MKKVKRLPFKDFQYIYSKVPRLCVDLVIKDKKGVLLTQRLIPPDIGRWHFPGGTVLYGETVADAVKRIAQEEIGVKVKILKQIGYLDYIRIPDTHAASIIFLIKPLSNNFRGSPQAEKIKFFKSVPKNTIAEHARFLREHFSKRTLS